MNNKRSLTPKQSKCHSDFMIGAALAQREVSDNILVTSISSATTASSGNYSFLHGFFFFFLTEISQGLLHNKTK